MAETLYQTELFGAVRIVGRDRTGLVLIEATERRDTHPEWPHSIEPGHREWISQHAIGEPITPHVLRPISPAPDAVTPSQRHRE